MTPAAPQPATDEEVARLTLLGMGYHFDRALGEWVKSDAAPHSAGPAAGSVAPTLSGSGESSSPSVGSSVAHPLSKTRFFGLLSGLHIVDERAYNDPDGYDGGVMLCRLDRLYATVRAAIDAAMGSATEPRPLGTGR